MHSSAISNILAPFRTTRVLSEVIEGVLCIGTHSGSFHCDEPLAVGMLKLLPEYQDACIVRTRDPATLQQCAIVVDVGAEYDPERKRFDHHQRGFSTYMPPFSTKLSSAGLVYMHFGDRVIQSAVQGLDLNSCPIEVLHYKMYENFIEEIDSIDNGIEVSEAPRYKITTTLSSRVGRLNPSWNMDSSPETVNECFREAMLMVTGEFVERVRGYVESWWPGRAIVQRAFQSRHTVHPSGRIIELESFCPWQDHLFELEESGSQVLFCLFQDSGAQWRIQAVPVEKGSFTSRLKLPDNWCGLRDAALDEATGCPGGVFVHAGGFIGGHKTSDGIRRMATLALEMGNMGN